MLELNPIFAGLQPPLSTPGEHDAGNQNLVAELQQPDFFSVNGKFNFFMG
jgi:hypothetical protein